jgi:hypothetical protein
MGDSHFQVLFDAALQEYTKKTGIALANHPLAEKFSNCDSVESITSILCEQTLEQTQAFSEFQENDKVLKPLKKTVLVLYNLSGANFDQTISPVRPGCPMS